MTLSDDTISLGQRMIDVSEESLALSRLPSIGEWPVSGEARTPSFLRSLPAVMILVLICGFLSCSAGLYGGVQLSDG